jgi:hypothetical protein
MILLIAKAFFWFIGILFFLGMVGSAVVVILTSIEDVRELREKKEDEAAVKVPQEHHFGDTFPVGTTSSGH